VPHDTRLPHLRDKLTGQIHKTALGAEQTVTFEHDDDPIIIIQQYKKLGFTITALEQTYDAILLPNFAPVPKDMVLILGEEVNGMSPELLQLCDVKLEIPMVGKKESFNVSVATGIALYALTTRAN
jgi:tRNA G18 (ribose-2'-O)-methylase SpoU